MEFFCVGLKNPEKCLKYDWLGTIHTPIETCEICKKIGGFKKPTKFNTVKKECKYCELLNEEFSKNRPCYGKKIICHNEKTPFKEWYSGNCRENKCNFFEEKI